MDARAREMSRIIDGFIHDQTSGDFESLALDVFAYQYERNRHYRAFCDGRGVSPDRVTSWSQVPAIPSAAFKEVDLACAPAAITFRTSGTTRGGSARGRHPVADPILYESSLLAGFRHFVLPDRDRVRVLSLVPALDEQLDSSLSYMVAVVLREIGDAESGTYVSEHAALLGALFAALERASGEGEPVLIIGTTLALVPVLAAAEEAGARFQLPPGSRIVDTGGAKGLDREFDDVELLERYCERFGVEPAACANEYGMTEMLSQFYNDDLRRWALERAGEGARSARAVVGCPRSPDRARKRPPHWVRTRVLDPETLDDADVGLLCHVDLANCHSVMAIQTEDLGRRIPGGFLLSGRLPGSGSRGCSIAMDEWLR